MKTAFSGVLMMNNQAPTVARPQDLNWALVNGVWPRQLIDIMWNSSKMTL
jgi:hypothetical protein